MLQLPSLLRTQIQVVAMLSIVRSRWLCSSDVQSRSWEHGFFGLRTLLYDLAKLKREGHAIHYYEIGIHPMDFCGCDGAGQWRHHWLGTRQQWGGDSECHSNVQQRVR